MAEIMCATICAMFLYMFSLIHSVAVNLSKMKNNIDVMPKIMWNVKSHGLTNALSQKSIENELEMMILNPIVCIFVVLYLSGSLSCIFYVD